LAVDKRKEGARKKTTKRKMKLGKNKIVVKMEHLFRG
jgi:hypothetical protein